MISKNLKHINSAHLRLFPGQNVPRVYAAWQYTTLFLLS